ncbi:MAG: hypothetical protein LAT51_05780 [Flavobacteriaceae bacterium]|nr:hypothetical protein [Flavobacteriaceae bacterium]
MKQVNITINVPDNKFDKLITFLSENFGSISVNQMEDFKVPEWHKEIVLKRQKNATKEDFFSVDDLGKKIKL